MTYANGEIPLDVLIRVPGQEDDDAWLSATTCARWLALKQDVYDTYGVTIWIVPGWNAYRPVENQIYARNQACAEGRCGDAAVPRTSSHGGRYVQAGSDRNGAASLAIDVGGYEALDRDDWYAMCRKHGFEPGFFDWEPWHIIDWDPRIGEAAPASNNTPISKPRRKKHSMNIHAAWRNDDGSIAIQCRPGGKLTWISDPYDFAGMAAGSGVEAAQVTNDRLKAIADRYGILDYPKFDTGRDALPSVVYVPQGDGTAYALLGDHLVPLVDPGTLSQLHAAGAASFSISPAERDNFLSRAAA